MFFWTPLELRVLSDGEHYELVNPLIWQAWDERKVVVPTGFITDMTSVPQVFWNILPPSGKYTRAAVVHDWLYRAQEVTRSQADEYFREAMHDIGVNKLQRAIIFAQVRMWGWIAWDKHTKEGAWDG